MEDKECKGVSEVNLVNSKHFEFILHVMKKKRNKLEKNKMKKINRKIKIKE